MASKKATNTTKATKAKKAKGSKKPVVKKPNIVKVSRVDHTGVIRFEDGGRGSCDVNGEGPVYERGDEFVKNADGTYVSLETYKLQQERDIAEKK